MSLVDEILRIGFEVMEVEPTEIPTQQNLLDLGLNSISFIKMVVKLENIYDIEFEDDYLDFARYTSIQQLSDYVEAKIRQKENED